MTSYVPCGPDSLSGSGGFFSNVPGVRRQQISRINAYVQGKRADAKKSRVLRNARYREKIGMARLPEDVRAAITANPRQHGAPRCFKVLLAGKDIAAHAKLHDTARFVDEGHFVHFAAFGIPNRAVRLNSKWIKPEHVKLSPDGRIYTLATANPDGSPFNMHLDFTQVDKPVGHIETDNSFLALSLQPWAVAFNVNVAADAGAYYSSGKSTLVWDDSSTQWKNAHWEQNSMVFSYDTVKVDNPFGGSFMANEVSFQDPKSSSVSEFTVASYGTEYTSLFQDIVVGSKQAHACVTTINDGYVTPAPQVRSADAVKTVFPQLAIFTFDELGDSFTGAFKVAQLNAPDLVYAVVGTGIMPEFPTMTPGPVQPGGQFQTLEATAQPSNKTQALFQTRVKAVPHAFSLAANGASTILPVSGLINNDPMVPDPNNPTGYVDSVAQLANQDFNDIICYHMDSDIHTTFVSASPTVLADATVKAIATDSPDNATFYKTLQVPYVTSNLGRSTLAEGKQCNVVRAEAQLKTLPADSPVYKRHSDALYRHRYMQAFPGIQNYLDDQARTDYSQNMASGAAAMKTRITTLANGVNGIDPTDKTDTLAAALADVDSLSAWATSQKLFYAFDLYNWCETFFLPNLIAQSANGSLSASISRTMKKLTLIFGILERGQQNPNGNSFTEAFNGLIRLFQMSTLIPQFVDADSASQDLDSIEKEMLNQFYKDNIGSSDPKIVAEAQRALKLATDGFLRMNFFNSLAASMRMGGSLGSWAAIMQLNQNFLQRAAWYQKLVGAADMGATFMRVSCVALLVLPMISSFGGGWSEMTSEQKTTWVITCAALALTFFIKALQGGLRLYYFWSDLAGFTQCLKAFMGFQSVLKTLPQAATKTENAFAQWMMRGGGETMEITGEEVTVGMKIFGRSAGEFLTNCVGVVLAGVNIVMSAIDLSKTTDPLQQTMDSLFIASSALQLLAIGASWLVSAAIVTSELAVSILSTAAAILGPLAIILAVAGLVVMIVMACLHKDPPNPVQDFVDKHAAPAGLKMDHDTAIDYFNIVPADASSPSLNGISFESKLTSTPTASVMQLGSPSSPSTQGYGINAGGTVTYLPDTCWNVKTDSTGITTIWTYYMDPVNGESPLCLAEGSDGQLHALPPPAKSTKDASGADVPVDPATYAKNLAMQQWTFQTMSEATTATRTDGNDKTTYVTSAQFKATRNNKFLTLKARGDGTQEVVLDSTDASDASRSVTWTLTLQSMGPSTFNYIQPDWKLNTSQKDEQNGVVFAGSTSSPLTWSITPALPSFLTLSSTDGTIKQAPGVTPTVSAATVYTVTAAIAILSKEYSRTATVTITVTDATVNPADAATLLMTLDEDTASTSGAAVASGGGLRSRFAGPSMKSAGQGPANGGATEDISLLKVQSEPLDFMELQSRFQALKQTAPSFFDWQQPSGVQLSQHYTAAAAIAKMKNSLTGSWQKSKGMFSTEDVPYQSIYFPNPPAMPPAGTNDPLDYHGAAQAFVVQSIHNGDGDVQSSCNINNASNTVATFNQALWTTNTQRFIDWLQSPQSTSTTSAHCTLDQYQQTLEHPDWLAYKRATQANGGWPNQSYEMYFHLLKLASLGASPSQISSIFSTITRPTGGLEAGGFADITPGTWTAYTGYMSSGGISAGQLGVQGLNTKQYIPVPRGPAIVNQADWEFVRYAGYYQSPPSSCCFAKGTRMLLADGRAALPIEELRPGMRVASPTPKDPKAARAVLGVSRPRRAGRPLYALRGAGGARFTATHPVLLRYEAETARPVLGFVDVAAALAGNPLWAAGEVEALPAETLVQSAAPVGGGEEDERLFDLLLEPGDGVPVFVVEGAGGAGDTLTVCSEAPDVAALPGMTRFVLALVEAVASRGGMVGVGPDELRADVLEYTLRIKEHRQTSAAAVVSGATSRFGKELGLDTALSVIDGANHDSQALMDASEAVAGALGLGLQCHLDNGWQYTALSSKIAENQVFCLSTHHITLAQASLLKLPASHKIICLESLAALRNTLSNNEQLRFSVSTFTGNDKAAIVEVKCNSIGAHLHRLHSAVVLNSVDTQAPWSTQYKLSISLGADNSTVVVAEGTVLPDVPALWPLHIEKLRGVDGVEALRHWHIGWVSVSGAVVPQGLTDDMAAQWTQASRDSLPRMELYAEALGAQVGKNLAEMVLAQADDERAPGRTENTGSSRNGELPRSVVVGHVR